MLALTSSQVNEAPAPESLQITVIEDRIDIIPGRRVNEPFDPELAQRFANTDQREAAVRNIAAADCRIEQRWEHVKERCRHGCLSVLPLVERDDCLRRMRCGLAIQNDTLRSQLLGPEPVVIPF